MPDVRGVGAEAMSRELEILNLQATVERLLRIIAAKNKAIGTLHFSDIERLEKRRKEARLELAEELKSGRARLAQLNKHIDALIGFLNAFAGNLLDRAPEYPPSPRAMVPATATGDGLPKVSGVYFVWSGDLLVYIGQSGNIAARARLKVHRNIREGDWLSWLPFQPQELNWAECFYIGIHRPILNFGTAQRVDSAEVVSE